MRYRLFAAALCPVQRGALGTFVAELGAEGET